MTSTRYKEIAMTAVAALAPAAPVHKVIPLVAASTQAAQPIQLKTQCSTCHLRELCLPCGMASPDVERLDEMKFMRRRIKAEQPLFSAGERFHYLYAVRSGTLKSSLATADGREQVSGFYLAGELIGLDGAANGTHASSATALEDTEVCAIPYEHLTEMSVGNAGMQRVVSRLMGREIVREHSLMMLLGSMNAEERLAAFLLNLSQRMKARGYSAAEFHLRMSRADIGSYLGMKLETVSRTFSAFQRDGLLQVDKRHIRILNMDGLQRLLDSQLN
jgi:CRP/FNR family transcriptional regulator